MHVKNALAACAIAIAAAATTVSLHAGEASLVAARELYESAAYEDALVMLNGLLEGTRTPEDDRSIGLYRVLCLMALDRTTEAENAVGQIVSQHPLYRPSAGELSPRVRAAFADARTRLLPSIIQQRYVVAKTAFDRREFATAATAFKRVLDELADPDIAAAASQHPLSDLRTLALGFHDLSATASAPPPAVIPAPTLAPSVRDFRRVYTAADRDVVPPTTVRQTLPPLLKNLTGSVSGVIEVVIDATGAVESAMMQLSIDPQYDRAALSAAKNWQYQPATVDGVPVRFLKRVQINVTFPTSARVP